MERIMIELFGHEFVFHSTDRIASRLLYRSRFRQTATCFGIAHLRKIFKLHKNYFVKIFSTTKSCASGGNERAI
jgi:hypothetical protein